MNANIRTAGKIQTIDVTLEGLVTIDDLESDHKYDDETVRVSYYIGERGGVVVIGCQYNDARPGKDDYWVAEHLPRFMTRMIERMIEREVRERIAA